MGNLKPLFPIAISLLIALSGTLFLYRWINGRSAPVETIRVESETVPVTVAAVDLPWGTIITPEMVKTTPFLMESLPSGSWSDPADLTGRVTIAPLKQGDPFVEHRLAPVSVKTGGIAAILAPGKRAIAVKGDKVIGISGFINPGSRVDVLVTLKDPDTRTGKTKMVLANIRVLASGSQLSNNGTGEPAPVDVFTLEVTPEEAERLALAGAMGKLQFALRNLTDQETVLTKGTTILQTLGALSLNEPAPAEPAAAAPARKKKIPENTVTVEVIKGNEISREKMKL